MERQGNDLSELWQYISQSPSSALSFQIGVGSGLTTEHDGCSDADGGKEQLTASVVAGGDAAPVLEARKEVLDSVALLVVLPVVTGGYLPPAPGGELRSPETLKLVYGS